MDAIINQIISNFDFAYMFVVNILTYILIKVIDWANGDKIVPIWQKRLLLIISIIIVAYVYTFVGYDNKIVLVNSSIVAPIAWSWILRPIFIKLGAGYKQPK